MILKIKIFLLVLLLSACALNANIERVCFPPGCENLIIHQIDSAKSEIRIQAYSFTSAPIAEALLAAHKRGVTIQIILDKSQRTDKYSSYTFFKNTGVPVFIDSAHSIAHNKIIIIDREIVITGSFNFTKAAETKNAENLLIIKSSELAQKYLDNWTNHKQHSGE